MEYFICGKCETIISKEQMRHYRVCPKCDTALYVRPLSYGEIEEMRKCVKSQPRLSNEEWADKVCFICGEEAEMRVMVAININGKAGDAEDLVFMCEKHGRYYMKHTDKLVEEFPERFAGIKPDKSNLTNVVDSE